VRGDAPIKQREEHSESSSTQKRIKKQHRRKGDSTCAKAVHEAARACQSDVQADGERRPKQWSHGVPSGKN